MNYCYPIKYIDEAIILTSRWTSNYSHFTLDALSRLSLADELDEYRSIPVLFDRESLSDYSQYTLFNWLNKHNHPVIIEKTDLYI